MRSDFSLKGNHIGLIRVQQEKYPRQQATQEKAALQV